MRLEDHDALPCASCVTCSPFISFLWLVTTGPSQSKHPLPGQNQLFWQCPWGQGVSRITWLSTFGGKALWLCKPPFSWRNLSSWPSTWSRSFDTCLAASSTALGCWSARGMTINGTSQNSRNLPNKCRVPIPQRNGPMPMLDQLVTITPWHNKRDFGQVQSHFKHSVKEGVSFQTRLYPKSCTETPQSTALGKL